jgi:hypothetical protein
MPYKDSERKKEWERLHRPQRLARRRELRRIEATQQAARPKASSEDQSGVGFLIPVVTAAGALAAHNPKLAIGSGGLVLAFAAIYKKGWTWWIVGALIMALGFLFYWSNRSTEKRS